MRLFGSLNSPYVRKVRVTALELSISDRIEFISTDPRDAESGFWNTNPLGKIPALVTDDGAVIYDSPVICEYLDDAFGQELLLLASGDRWRTRTLVALADGAMDAAMAARLEKLRPESEQSPSWIEKQLATAGRALDRLARDIPGLGERTGLASIAAGCAVQWIGFRHPEVDWLGPRPALASWFAAFSEREAMRETAPST